MKAASFFALVVVFAVSLLICPGSQAQNTEAESNHAHSDSAQSTHEDGNPVQEVGEEGAGDDHQAEAAHDHATGHGAPGKRSGFIQFMGKFHPLAVHFPIALLLAAALSEVLAMVRKTPPVSDVTLYCLLLGAAGAVGAAALGWANALGASYDSTIGPFALLTLHRWIGTTTAVLGVITLVLAVRAQQTPEGKPVGIFRAALLVSSLFVSVAGHLGALLVYGMDYFS